MVRWGWQEIVRVTRDGEGLLRSLEGLVENKKWIIHVLRWEGQYSLQQHLQSFCFVWNRDPHEDVGYITGSTNHIFKLHYSKQSNLNYITEANQKLRTLMTLIKDGLGVCSQSFMIVGPEHLITCFYMNQRLHIKSPVMFNVLITLKTLLLLNQDWASWTWVDTSTVCPTV